MFSRIACLVVTFAIAARLGAQELTVFIHDYAGVDDVVMRGAEAAATRILGTAGIPIKWVVCRHIENAPTGCSRSPLPAELVVQLLPAGTWQNLRQGALGFAVPPESGPFGCYAVVLYDRVRQLSASSGADTPLVLGHAIVHEIGHLLLGPDSHALSGIMKAEWTGPELVRAAQGTLLFPNRETHHIRKNVLLRLQATRPGPVYNARNDDNETSP